VRIDDPVSASAAVAELAAGSAGPGVGAFFDLDGTLVAGFTATAHAADRLRRRQASIGEVLGVAEAMMRYRFGRMEFERLVVQGSGYLRGESLAELQEVGERLFVDRIATRLLPGMRAVVHAHQERGHTVVLCSSALSIHAHPVASFLGISHVVCNYFAVDDRGRLTGDIVRPIVWGPTKADAVQRFCTDNTVALEGSYFYADGGEDVPLMALVGHPRPVNPRPRLAAVAAERGWPVLRVAASSGRMRVRSLFGKGA
jgi:HAD superfamily hydrolase (TIGR01490 family)